MKIPIQISNNKKILAARVRPSCASSLPSKNRGRREDRVRAAPAVSRANSEQKNAHEHTGSAEAIRPSLRNGFTAYAVLSPATNSSCHRHRRIKVLRKPGWAYKNLRRLDTSNGCQDHTALPSAAIVVRLRAVIAHWSKVNWRPALRSHPRARRCRVHRIPSRVRDDREPPLLGDETVRL